MVPNNATAPLWTLNNLGVRYRKAPAGALVDINVSTSSRAVALLGPNGAGKTTLFKVLSTTLEPTTGTFQIAGVSTSGRSEREQLRRRLGYLPQHFQAFGGYTCEELVSYVAWLRRIDPKNVSEAVHDKLAAVGLADRATAKVKTLSGGMRQRLGLAQALVNSPTLLLLDEPTVGLDPEQRATFMAYLKSAAETTSVLLATHLVEDVAAFADDVIVLNEGRVIFDGPLHVFCADEANGGPVSGGHVQQAYLRAVAASRAG